MPRYDVVLVGSGINALACAALVSRAGLTACVLERSPRLGGAIHTVRDLTAPGYTHEVLSSWHPLFAGSAAYAELKDELERHGLRYLGTELATATAFPDGEAAVLSTSHAAMMAELDRHSAGDGTTWDRQFQQFMAAADTSFGVISAVLWSLQGLGLAGRAFRGL